MVTLSLEYVRKEIAKSEVIFARGESIYLLGNYALQSEDAELGEYAYAMGGTYGDYAVSVSLRGERAKARCSCPFPHGGCKHVVAACLDIAHRQSRVAREKTAPTPDPAYLTPEEIRALAVEGRAERAKTEAFALERGETYKGAHTVRTPRGAAYEVTVYSASERTGHCTCPDFATNHLETCKHLIFALGKLDRHKDLREQADTELFPFVHLTWSSRMQAPVCHYERIEDPELDRKIRGLFNERGVYTKDSISHLFRLYDASDGIEALRFDATLLARMEDILYAKELTRLERAYRPDFSFLNVQLYPYQQEGVKFATFKKAAIIADEMGLGKTAQAIAVSVLKKRLFGFTKVLVVCPSSLKHQWKREIERFTAESSVVVAGGKTRRQELYAADESFFKITNYEALLRDLLAVRRWSPDLVILDEAQRIKNFETKTHQALMSVPRSHCLVITGTPLENRLEDVYSIVQFADRTLLTPLWAFAANHLNMSSVGRHKVLGYRNLQSVHDKISRIVIRRSKAEVFDSLPDQITNTYYLDLSREQEEIHQGYLVALLAIINKKVITPLDVKQIQKILLSMRMVCDSTFLIDRATNISPKLVELAAILRDLVLSSGRKVVLFTEWTTMSYLIGKVLSELGIPFVEFTGKVPVEKRPLLIDRFQTDPACMVFLATDAGGLGLNLQSADCVVNFELPWNPARLNQRIGRVNRIGQKSTKINVVNLVCKSSIEEKVLAGISLKQELFSAVLDGGTDEVDFGPEKRSELVNEIRAVFGGESIEPRREPLPSPDLDEATPHFLNPDVLMDPEQAVDVGAEEPGEEVGDTAGSGEESAARSTPADPAQVETVLNQGLAFLNSLAQMATGKAIVAETGRKAIEIDPVTGEVVLRFKLPGF